MVRGPGDGGFGGKVEGCGCFVEQQDVGVDEFGTGQRDQLPLAGREAAPALADGMVVSAGQPGDHVVCADIPRRLLDLFVGCARLRCECIEPGDGGMRGGQRMPPAMVSAMRTTRLSLKILHFGGGRSNLAHTTPSTWPWPSWTRSSAPATGDCLEHRHSAAASN